MLIILQDEKSKVKVLADLVSDEGSASAPSMATCCCVLMWGKGAPSNLFHENTSPIMWWCEHIRIILDSNMNLGEGTPTVRCSEISMNTMENEIREEKNWNDYFCFNNLLEYEILKEDFQILLGKCSYSTYFWNSAMTWISISNISMIFYFTLC